MTLEMRGICKSFGSNDVLKHVDFSIQGGEICALLGENGAGKSTLMNILGGVLPADAGEIVIDGTPVHFRTPSDSLSAGVAFKDAVDMALDILNGNAPEDPVKIIPTTILDRDTVESHLDENSPY